MTDIIDRILEREGWPAFTDKPFDHGGPTRGGLTLSTLSRFLGRTATVEELKALDQPTARQVYEVLFIIGPGFSGIADLHVREYMVDIGVTSSPERATRYLQFVLGVKIDGVCGSKTIAAANDCDPGALVAHLIARRCDMTAGFVQDNPDQLGSLQGWIRRAVGPLRELNLRPQEKTP